MAGHRTRLRLRVVKRLSSNDLTVSFFLDGREVQISSEQNGQIIDDADWLVFLAKDFSGTEEAADFGKKLKLVTEIASLCSMLGVDTGDDKSGAWINQDFAKSIGLIKEDDRIAQNIHGVSVIIDDDKNKFPKINAHAIIKMDAGKFLPELSFYSTNFNDTAYEFEQAIRTLNLAIINPEPLAQIALCLSTVEGLGQTEWSKSQKSAIRNLALNAEADPTLTEEERAEVADAIRRGVHRTSLRQGVLRLLSSLGLSGLKKEWDEIYGKRSAIFHGSFQYSHSYISELALKTIRLCGTIILSDMNKKGVAISPSAKLHFDV